MHPTENLIQGATGDPAVQNGGSHLAQVETKLDMILKNAKLGKQDPALEEQFAAQQEATTSSRLSHSYPKRSHKCIKACDANADKKRRAHQRVQVHCLEDSSDEDNSTMIHSSVHASRIPHCD